MFISFPDKTTFLQLPAPTGELEVIVDIPPLSQAKALPTIVIICHPHPLHGGTMHNKVVTTLVRAFQDLSLPCVRFNFRGVGKSTGEYGDGKGEIVDLETIIAWVKQNYPKSALWLAGFSFGAYISTAIAARGGIKQLVSIAPPTMYPEFQSISHIPCPWLVIQGDADEVFDAEEVFAWLAHTHPQAHVIRMEKASHFFHGRLVELRQILIEQLKHGA